MTEMAEMVFTTTKTTENSVFTGFSDSDDYPVLYCRVLAVLAGLGQLKPSKTV